MMRKLTAWIALGMVMLMGTNAIAETFEIRNGIHFGMSVEEVIEVEKGNGLSTGNEPKEANGDTANAQVMGYKPGKNLEIYYLPDSIAGIDGGNNHQSIRYVFEASNNSLYAIEYWFGYFSTTSNYEEIQAAFEEKYGEPLHKADGEFFSPYTPSLGMYFLYAYLGADDEKLSDYSQRLVSYDDINVVIETVLMYSTKTGRYELRAGYRSITNEELEQIISDTNAAQTEKERQRNSDI